MPDPLFLSLWFTHFEAMEMLARAVAVMKQFPFSTAQPGITHIALHPVSWGEATVLEQRFRPGISPEEAAQIAADLLHEDSAYVFEAYWDLWSPQQDNVEWILQPSQVKFIVQGKEFERAEPQAGDIQIDFGLDSAFLHEELQLSSSHEEALKANVQRLINFIAAVKKNSGAAGRLLWSESEENLAQKLIARLQRVQ